MFTLASMISLHGERIFGIELNQGAFFMTRTVGYIIGVAGLTLMALSLLIEQAKRDIIKVIDEHAQNKQDASTSN